MSDAISALRAVPVPPTPARDFSPTRGTEPASQYSDAVPPPVVTTPAAQPSPEQAKARMLTDFYVDTLLNFHVSDGVIDDEEGQTLGNLMNAAFQANPKSDDPGVQLEAKVDAERLSLYVQTAADDRVIETTEASTIKQLFDRLIGAPPSN